MHNDLLHSTINIVANRHQCMVISIYTGIVSVCNKKKHLVTDLTHFVCSNLLDATANEQVQKRVRSTSTYRSTILLHKW